MPGFDGFSMVASIVRETKEVTQLLVEDFNRSQETERKESYTLMTGKFVKASALWVLSRLAWKANREKARSRSGIRPNYPKLVLLWTDIHRSVSMGQFKSVPILRDKITGMTQ